MFKSFIHNFMGLAGTKVTEKKEPPKPTLTRAEIEFVLVKLRDAQYKGSEFEMFFNVFNKLTNQIPK